MKQSDLRDERNNLLNKLGANGYFSILKHESNSAENKVVNVTSDAYEISELINESEADLKLDEVGTMITTVVNFGRPNHHQQMLSERLLLASEQLSFADLRKND